ncbi:hypothetical protein ACFL5F_01005 [Planctomycetota bacterium]
MLNRIKTETEKIMADALDVTTEAETKAKAVDKINKEDFHKFGAIADKTRPRLKSPYRMASLSRRITGKTAKNRSCDRVTL